MKMKYAFDALKIAGVAYLIGLAGSVDTGKSLSEIIVPSLVTVAALISVHALQRYLNWKRTLKKF